MTGTGADHDREALLEGFEQLRAASPDGWRVELLEGDVLVTPVGTGRHATTVSELVEQLWDEDRRRTSYTGVGLALPDPAGEGRVLPDLVLAPRGGFRNQIVWQVPDAVLLVAEVTSALTVGRDRGQKVRGYARARIPLYVLIDREAAEVVVRSEPVGDDYAHKSIHKLGTVVPLPEPLGLTIDTAQF
ncbi:Uma2 family endonuclease [Streptomyces sp. NPDC127092]|uniref:Uma2 family endonuclease n=1 Tax=Streptomyces sp. NPDC127092 TaxID=3347135 RepID=UPI003658F178